MTGAASGIGKALAEELAAKGARAVVLLDRQTDLLEEVAQSLRSDTTETKTYTLDVRNFEDVQRAVTETVDTYGRLDFIFNNAGVLVTGTLEEIGLADFNYVVDVNVRGVVNGVYAAYPVMKQQGFGHIVNTASLSGLAASGIGHSAYGTSKFAVVGLTENLRIEAASYGVRCSALCPGFVDTPILKMGGKYGKFKTPGATQQEIDEFVEQIQTPMDPKKLAAQTLKLAAKNKPIIVLPGFPWKMMLLVIRLFPSFGRRMAQKRHNQLMKKMEEKHQNK